MPITPTHHPAAGGAPRAWSWSHGIALVNVLAGDPANTHSGTLNLEKIREWRG